MKQSGVVGLGVALGREGRPCLEILTHGLAEEDRQRIKRKLGDVPVTFTEVGPIVAQ